MADKSQTQIASERKSLTQERLREVLHYDPVTGGFTWKVMLSSRREAGAVAGGLKPSGYILIGVDGHRYRAHRLAWLYVTGEWPPDQIDHWDNVRSHNWWSNLRAADNQLNQANARRSKNNTSGFKGVYRHRDKWRAKINVGRRHIHLGTFADPATGGLAYERAAKEYFGEFARAA